MNRISFSILIVSATILLACSSGGALIAQATPTRTPTSTRSNTPTPTVAPTQPSTQTPIPSTLGGLTFASAKTIWVNRQFICDDAKPVARFFSMNCKKETTQYKANLMFNGRTSNMVDYVDLTVEKLGNTADAVIVDLLVQTATMPFDKTQPSQTRSWIEKNFPIVKSTQKSQTTIINTVPFELYAHLTIYQVTIGDANPNPQTYATNTPSASSSNAASKTTSPARTPTATSVSRATPTSALSNTCPQGCTSQLPGCAIKGNISSGGEKIYHVPSGASYQATDIDPSKGERWFCTEAEAQANGWRRAQR